MNQFASMDRCVLRVGVVSALVALAASAAAQEIGGGSKGAVTGAAGGATADHGDPPGSAFSIAQ